MLLEKGCFLLFFPWLSEQNGLSSFGWATGLREGKTLNSKPEEGCSG